MIQTGVKSLQMEEEKFRYDTMTDAVGDPAAEKRLLLQCRVQTPGQIQIRLLSVMDRKALIVQKEGTKVCKA